MWFGDLIQSRFNLADANPYLKTKLRHAKQDLQYCYTLGTLMECFVRELVLYCLNPVVYL
ncbi:hypothetical protein C427_4805 [Paraglaciecola psychrophila 170]|uniref:Uncharacterized protein n=1 Tax=Paraglaciecola psychrophila 170 TaxID=1129794 RepID=K6Z4E6_9ALTE|nr:hypothetical protein C427_4805 [Paraglaciecola psychrophila 170]GAC39939.1 hypothetical protein GPSY_4336 [Paraglaciecola psychrophila 170]